MLKNERLAAVGILFFACSNVCFAEATVGDLKVIQAKTILAQAEAAQYKAEADRNDYRAKSSNPNIESAPSIVPGQAQNSLPSSFAGKQLAKVEDIDPVVRAVYGSNGKMSATFMYASGAKYDAAVGDIIPGNIKIESIAMDKVVVIKSGHSRVLVFSDVAPAMPATTQTGNGNDVKFPLNAMPIN